MGPSRVAGGLGHSSSSSGIFFQGDEQSHSLVNTHLSSSFGNSSNSIPGTGRSNLGPVSGDMNNAVLNSVANSGPSVGASSMVTDANSGLSGGPRLQRSASINTDSYMRLPASPMSFTSNNISISGSSIVDGSSAVQQGNHQDSNASLVQQGQQQPGASTATSLLAPQNGQMPFAIAGRATSPFLQDPSNLSQVQKKPRLDIKQEGILQQQALQQYLQRQDSMHLQSRNPQLQTLLQQQRLMQQQQILQSITPSQRVQLQQQQQQQQQQQMHLRQQMQQQGMQPSSAVKRSYDGGVCARRLMQFLYHQRQRPPENSIAYWRKVVNEYYSPRAKKRWCLSMYDNVGQHALGVFPQAAMEAWHCEICGSKSGRGFEATFEVLPRLNEIKFGSGVIDELLFLDLPRECRFPSGIMILEYGRAVQESIYENLRVVREGQLRIIFNQDLKILSWEFCARRHEELLPRRVIAPQVNQLLQVAQKCQSTVSEGGSDGVSQQDLQANSNMVGSAGRQLVKCLEIPALNDLGFSKRYVRSLQISEVVNSMKDLIDYSREHKVGPIEGLKSYPRHAMAAKLQMQRMREMEQLANVQGLPTDRNSLNNLMSLHPGSSNNHHMVNRGGLNGSAQAAMALTNFQNLLNRQNSMNSNPSSLQQDAASPFNNSPTTSYQGPSAFGQGSRQQSPTASSLLSPHLPSRQPYLLQRSLSNSSSFVHNQQQPSQGNQSLQQQMFQMLNDVSNNTGPRVQPHSLPGQNGHGNLPRNAVACGSSTSMVAPVAGAPMSTVTGPAPTRSNSFKASSNSDSSAAGGINNGFNPTIGDFPQNPLLQDDIVQDIANGFAEDGFFNNDLDDDMGFGWKA